MAGNALRIYFFCSMRISNSDLKLKFGGSTFLFAQGSGYNRFKRQSRKPQNPKHGTETIQNWVSKRSCLCRKPQNPKHGTETLGQKQQEQTQECRKPQNPKHGTETRYYCQDDHPHCVCRKPQNPKHGTETSYFFLCRWKSQRVENLKIPNTGLKHISPCFLVSLLIVENLKIPNTGLKPWFMGRKDPKGMGRKPQNPKHGTETLNGCPWRVDREGRKPQNPKHGTETRHINPV